MIQTIKKGVVVLTTENYKTQTFLILNTSNPIKAKQIVLKINGDYKIVTTEIVANCLLDEKEKVLVSENATYAINNVISD